MEENENTNLNTSKNNSSISFYIVLLIIVAIIMVINFYNVTSGNYDHYYGGGMSTQEVQAFNSNFETYTGKQTGSQVKALLTYCSGNAKTYEDNVTKVPRIHYAQLSEDTSDAEITNIELTESTDEALKEFNSNLSTISSKLELKHVYRIVLDTDSTTGYIRDITIQYDPTCFGIVPGELE